MNEEASKSIAGERAGPAAPTESGTVAFEDTVLVQRTRQGDMQAFGVLIAKYQDRIFNMIMRMCPRRAEAEELTQDTFLRALERLSQFRGHSKFYTWLFRIAANLTISYRRRHGRVRFQSLTGSLEFEEAQTDCLTASVASRRQADPLSAAMSAETNRRVFGAIEELEDEYRLVVILRDMEGMNYAEISQVIGLPLGTVKSRLHRARNILREKLSDLIGA